MKRGNRSGLAAKVGAIWLLWVMALPVLAERVPEPRLCEPLRWAVPDERAISSPRTWLGAAGGFSVSNQDRNAVAAFYHSVYADSENVPDEWTGSIASCNEGAVSSNYLSATLRRINYFRAMCGLPASITLDTNWNQFSQKAALMMSRNNALSHYPPTTWSCFTADGSNAASHANLALGMQGPEAMDGFMSDTGGGNAAAGHRRWFLYPPNQVMGIGTLPGEGSYGEAAAVWVIGGTGSRPSSPPFVSWPNAGYCPYSLAYERWSFSVNGANFSGATVTMTCAGAPIGVVKEAVANGYGDNTLVWKVSGFPIGQVAADSNYVVCVSNVVIGGGASNFTYSVTLINPSVLLDVIAISGDEAPCESNVNVYTFTPVSSATAYVIRISRLTAGNWFEGAEAGTNFVTTHIPANYAFLTNSSKASGTNSFHIAANWGGQYFDLNHVVRPASNSQWLFKTRMRYATPTQYSAALVSADEGASWDTVWSKYGTNGIMDSIFESHAIALGGYTGCHLRLRFLHYSGGTSYIGSNDNYGVYVDDIHVTNSQELLAYSNFAVSAASFDLYPETTDTFVLEAAPVLGGHVFPYGESLFVQSRGQPCNVTPSFSSMTLSPADMTLSFVGESGRTYRVYYIDEMTNSAWDGLVATLEAQTSFLCVTDNTPGIRQRFYRVLRD
ncbi:MAG: CAP domain-containing protein [Lentisphaerota bacterium]